MAKKPQNKAFAIRYLKQAKAKEAQTQKLEGFTENLSSQVGCLS